jgi:hypothetical protein
MRTWVNLTPAKDLDPRLIKLFKQINLNGQQQSTAMFRIGQGLSPDNAGNTLFDGTPYFKLAGRAGGQIGYGGVGANESLTLSSTSSSTKGAIYLGTASAFNETSVLLGLNTTTPTARVEVHNVPTSYTFYPPVLMTSAPGWRNSDGGTTNLHTYIDEDPPNDVDSINDVGTVSGIVAFKTGPITPVPSTSGVYIVARMRWTGTHGGTGGLAFTMSVWDGGGNSLATLLWPGFVAAGAHGDVAAKTFYYKLTSTQITNLGAGSPKWDFFRMQLAGSGGGVGYSGLLECTSLSVHVYGSSSSTNNLAVYNDVNDLITTISPTGCISVSADSPGGQTENPIQITNALSSILGGFTPAGAPFYVTGAANGNFLKTTSTAGVGVWTAPATIGTAISPATNPVSLAVSIPNCLVAASTFTVTWTGTLPVALGGTGSSTLSGLTQVGTRSNLTAQTGDITTQTLLTGAAGTAGMYRVSVYLKTTGGAPTAGDIVTTTISWNDGTAQTLVVPFENATVIFNGHDLFTANAFSQGSIVVNSVASQNITYITTVTKNVLSTVQYEIHARIEALG